MSKAPAFQFYPKDFLSDEKVVIMDMEARGVYITLMCYDWNETGISNDQEMLKELCKNPKNWEAIWKKVGKCFYEKNERLYNPRLEEERKKQRIWRKKSSEGGKKSAAVRRRKARPKGGSRVVEPMGNRTVKPNPNSSSSSSSSSPSSNKPNNKEVGSGVKKAPDPPHLRIKFNFKEKKWQGIIDEDHARWKKTFPDVDIEYHIFTKMVEWIITNPRKGRKKNYARFINNWLSDEQEKVDLKNAGKRRDDKRSKEWFKEED